MIRSAASFIAQNPAGCTIVLMKRLLLLLAVAALFVQGQSQKEIVTSVTGRMWVLLPENCKLMYISGVSDGIMIAAGWADSDRQQILGSRATGFHAGEYMKELDTLYKSTENLPITVPLAYNWCNLKLKGTETNEFLEQRLIELRKFVAKY